jgi:hypothetical protein
MPNMFSFHNTFRRPANNKPKFVVTLLALGCTLGLQSPANAKDWWFDVEVIIFKRDVAAQSIAESFEHKAPSFASPTAFDLLSDYITPDLTYLSAGLPFCDTRIEAELKTQRGGQLTLVNDVFVQADFSLVNKQNEQALNGTNRLIEQLQASQNSEMSTVDREPSQDNLNSTGTKRTITEPNWVKWQIPQSLPCAFAQDRVLLRGPYDRPIPEPQPSHIPRVIDGVEWPERQSPYLLPKSAQQLTKLEEHIRWQKDLTPILHLTWRQPVVFGKNKAQPFKLIAGENYALAYNQDGKRKIEDDSNAMTDLRFVDTQQSAGNTEKRLTNDALFAQINAAIASSSPAEIIDFSQSNSIDTDTSIDADDFIQVPENPLWQVEGEFKVYLENLGRTPYLHIDSNLDFRAPITLRLPGETDVQPNNFLQSFHFDQLRRVISTQLHYFDHPLFGMVVQIRRYESPKKHTEN